MKEEAPVSIGASLLGIGVGGRSALRAGDPRLLTPALIDLGDDRDAGEYGNTSPGTGSRTKPGARTRRHGCTADNTRKHPGKIPTRSPTLGQRSTLLGRRVS